MNRLITNYAYDINKRIQSSVTVSHQSDTVRRGGWLPEKLPCT